MVRLDRLATLYVARPLRFRAAKNKSYLPVVMYHSISERSEAGVNPYFQTVTSPETFRNQMTWLKEMGWRGVTLEEGLRALDSGDNTENAVVITFDDGFEDFYTQALPALDHCGFKATMYLPTAFIEGASEFKGHRCMTWTQVRELHGLGIQFGSHTVNHPKLWDCSWTVIKSELTDSKHTIEDHLGVEASAFAYPFAFPLQDSDFVTRFEAELKSAGYTSCVTTTIGRMRSGDNRFRIQRLPLNNCDDRKLLSAKLVGSYDWLRWPQSARKNFRVPRSAKNFKDLRK